MKAPLVFEKEPQDGEPIESNDPADFLAHSEELLSELGTVFLVWSTGEVLLEA